MASVFEIKILPEGITRKFVFSRGNFYQLTDGSLLPLYSTLAWCHRCKDFCEAEYIGPPVQEIDQRLAELHDPDSEIYEWAESNCKGPGGPFRAEEITRWEKQRFWRERRVAPSKCLSCGTTEIVILSMGIEILSPFSSGTLFINGVGYRDTEPNNWIFSPEGDRIPSTDSRD